MPVGKDQEKLTGQKESLISGGGHEQRGGGVGKTY